MEDLPCSALTDALTELAQTSTHGRRLSAVKTISRSQTTSYLTDTADAVREVAKKMGKTRIKWENPKSVMIITKPGDYSLVGMTREIALYLGMTPRYGTSEGITVYVDEKLKESKRFRYDKIVDKYPVMKEKLKFWTPELCALSPKTFDFIITLGGDGTVLFSSWLFQNYIPPVIPFHLGSLGFLTPFDFDRFKLHLNNAMERGARINLRGRITCTVYRRVPHPDCKSPEEAKAIRLRNVVRNPVTGKITIGNWTQKQGNSIKKKFGEVDGEDMDEDEWHVPENAAEDELQLGEEREVPCFTTIPVEKYHVINDLVVDRGPSPYVSLLELFGDDKHLTTVQADGLAISTPTGSTAYSLSAGGSLTHPDIHAILITPICPHTLSFRPTLVPDSMELRICVPFNSRNTAWASFDGRGRVELKQGDHIKVTASRYPFPTVCKEDQATDWFNSLQNCLHWNKRERQKSFAVVESHATRSSSKSSLSRQPGSRQYSRVDSSSGSETPSRKASSSASSDTGHEAVFGMFYDDDRRNRRRSVSHHHGEICNSEDDESSEFSLSNGSADEFESDSDEYVPDSFVGWSDEEIMKARYMANISKELERVTIKSTRTE
ncbi:ATP-NAD kinase [Backusella circina FSU 941]|nr:ATP-NAD kinase [Backusella circina FSU 941]